MLLKTLIPFRVVVGVVFCVGFSFSVNAFGASTISGFIYDKQRNPLPEIDVELLNDYYQSVRRTRTDGTGRYQFDGLSDGRYTVRVYAFRYDLMDQEQAQEIVTQNVRGGEGTGYFPLDFYLLPRKGGLADSEVAVVFFQEVPEAARKTYEKALKHFEAKRTNEGITTLYESIQLFPTYYMALHRLGRELYFRKLYAEAWPFLMEAAKVNDKSAYSLYYLGNCFYFLGKEYNKPAITALNQAYVLAPSSPQVLYALGRAERAGGKYEEAEKHLLQAKKVSKEGVPDIHRELAQLYADDLKKYNEAANELELYLKASKKSESESVKTRKVIASLREKAKAPAEKN